MLVKICGIRRVEDAMAAAELGAAAVGFVFWPDSPRFVDPHRARRIVAALPPFVGAVGVFVDQPVEYVAAVATVVKLAAVQLHGDESAEVYAGLRARVIKTVPVWAGFEEVAERVPVHATVLLDVKDPARRGGTGRTVDWDAAQVVARRRRVILAGGLHAANVREAVERVRPYAIDLSSGVESAPGIKDHRKLAALFDALKEMRT